MVFTEGCSDKCEEYEGDLLRKQLIRNVVGAPTILMTKSVFEELDDFDEQMDTLEDWKFGIRAALKYRLGFVAEPGIKVSLEGERMSANPSKHFSNSCYILCKHYKTYTKENLLDSAVERLLLQAEQYGVRDAVEKMLLIYSQQMNTTNA